MLKTPSAQVAAKSAQAHSAKKHAAPPMLAGRLASTSSLLSLARIAGALAGFATQVVLARTLQASALGVFYSVTSLAAVVGCRARLSGHRPALSLALSRAGQGRAHPGLRRAGATRRDDLCRHRHAWRTRHRVVLAGAQHRGAPRPRRRGISIPANAAFRLYGSLAAAIRRFALAYLPDTCIRPFVLLGGVLLLAALGVTLTASNVTWLLTFVMTARRSV
jgi:hypothetical protein